MVALAPGAFEGEAVEGLPRSGRRITRRRAGLDLLMSADLPSRPFRPLGLARVLRKRAP